MPHIFRMGFGRSAVVVGGGVIGVTSAYTLARDGWQVRLVDRMPKLAMGASWGNGRQLSYSHTNALASPRLLPQIPKLLLGCNDAFRLSLRADLPFVHWLASFLRNSSSSAYRKNTLETLELAQQSRAAMDRLLTRHAISFDHRKAGKIVMLRSEQELQAASATLEMKRRFGLNQRLLSPQEACEIEPAIARSPTALAGALYAPDDETGDCNAFANGLCEVSQQHHGLEIITGKQIRTISKAGNGALLSLDGGDQIETDLVVIANGDRANELLGPIGHRLPIEAMKGYSFTAPLGNSAPSISVTDHAKRIVFTHLGDRMLVAGIAEMGRVDNSVDPARLQSMIKAARESLPEAAIYGEAGSGWAGMRPMTPNSQPIIRMLDRAIAVNVGHGMLGWTLAMGSAERLARMVSQSY